MKRLLPGLHLAPQTEEFVVFGVHRIVELLLNVPLQLVTIHQGAVELFNLPFFTSQELIVLMDGAVQGLDLTLESDDFLVEVLSLVAHILEILFDLSQQLILVFFLLLEFIELPLLVIFVLSDQSLPVFHVFHNLFQLFDLGLALFDIVEQLFLVLTELFFVILQLIIDDTLGLDLSLVLLIGLLNFCIFVSFNLC